MLSAFILPGANGHFPFLFCGVICGVCLGYKLSEAKASAWYDAYHGLRLRRDLPALL